MLPDSSPNFSSRMFKLYFFLYFDIIWEYFFLKEGHVSSSGWPQTPVLLDHLQSAGIMCVWPDSLFFTNRLPHSCDNQCVYVCCQPGFLIASLGSTECIFILFYSFCSLMDYTFLLCVFTVIILIFTLSLMKSAVHSWTHLGMGGCVTDNL